ncbi:alanine--glyoxylate aminotransferase family protein [Halorubrum ezzemoulense]|uniref:Alanine--glyoxylate aminotransferase family protein n=1 Tax=Halorubrum ezzemoulense TaxID=337243 RepID=A0ABT4YYX5_HALEZ|nr:alanine--glyoxylate aminotransferase family protein [Halorubrum ezzemoulense]MDB2241546.1 alanine--glyoxylate aminotransferase family protein [Halorubrum ezzemoulense]MDB2245634.1 alanine--glyoxylate aminotransferase family protein [Halorubrum ezzemoulense]MDB2250520.1 alanine--glyoxylate aminotransferase family protein [Halorubrum ezzemoulense]MDB2278988.1 alanine--glyoxylate aminotransferase family protein [Halorubrum ezzemoulense]MDB2285776.1 alanine--glyoxylate aminotransferase family p
MSERYAERGVDEKAPDVGELTPPDRTLMGPGPSDVHPRVLKAMSTPLVGHLDPSFVEIMDEVQELLRYTFRTDNQWTIPVSGTGSASMEAAIGNLVEPGDTMLVPTNGYFGGRMKSMAERAGGEVVEVDAPWGEPLDPVDVERGFNEHQPDVFGFVHAETSTGVRQPNVSELTDIAHAHDAFVIADCVTSLGGVEMRVDEWGVDAAYSGPQKCLSCPPGASPLTLNDRAMDKVLDREEPARSWYLDLSLLEGYWGDERAYHHTAPITNVYALREALRLVAEEGIEERWTRHREVAGDLKVGLRDLGLEMNAPDEYWLPSLNAVRVPDGVDDAAVIDRLLDEYDLEIASGLGDLEGDIWRIGCMGHSARPKNVEYVLAALEGALAEQGY